jgi:hypothetical protein
MEPVEPPIHRPAAGKQINSRHRRRRTIDVKQSNNSTVTNGTKLLLPQSERAWLRRLRDLLDLHIADLGGWDLVSNAEAAIVRRAVTLIVELERRETLFAKTACIDDASLLIYGTSANTLRRLLESIGLQRRSKDITPALTNALTTFEMDPLPEDPLDLSGGDP